MADNTTINTGTGGDTLRTDDVGAGVKIPVSKIHTGADGVDGGPVTTSNPFPTQTQSGSLVSLMIGGVINSPANPVPISDAGGSVTVDGTVVVSSATLVSGSQTGILVGANPVASTNPLPVTSITGSQIGILVGTNPVAQSNPLPTRPMSGSQTGILMGANPVAASNPFAVTSITGSQIGILIGANPVAISNPFPISDSNGSLTVDGTVVVSAATLISGSQTGLLIGANPVAVSNPLPISDAGGSLTVDGTVTVSAATLVSGSQTGLLIGANPVASTNPLPVLSMTGSVVSILVANPGSFGATPVAPTNPFPVSHTTGSQTGILVGANPAATTNPFPVGQVAEAASQMLSGSTYITVYHAFGDFASSGSANQIVAPAGAGKRIAVLSVEAMCLVATNVRFVSTGSAGTITNISSKKYLPANGGFALPHNPHAWFKTVANEGLNLDISAANAVGVTITWTIFNSP